MQTSCAVLLPAVPFLLMEGIAGAIMATETMKGWRVTIIEERTDNLGSHSEHGIYFNLECERRKMKRIIILTASALICLMVTGCYPTGEVDSPDSVPQYITEPSGADSDEESLENVIVNLYLPDTPEKTMEFDAAPRTWDNDNLISIFLNGKGEIVEDSYESDMTPGETRYVFDIPNQYRLIVESGYIKYSDRGNINRDEYTILQSSWATDEMDKIFGNDELDGFGSNVALEDLCQLLSQCGITDYGEPIVYPLHAEKVNQYFEENFSTMEHKDGTAYQVDWTEDEEAYLIVYPQIINGTELSTDSTYIDAIITRNGITELSVMNWVDINSASETETNIAYSSMDATNIIIDYYESLIQDTPVELCDCKLSMFPNSSVGELTTHFIPVWEFTVKTQIEENKFMLSRKYISVSSGKQVGRAEQ